jgi:two-component system, sensor histidine kinase and response regulator
MDGTHGFDCRRAAPRAILGTAREKLNVLAGGYLFTALTTGPYALSFPGGLSDNGLFITGPLSTPWIFLTWYAALPLVVIAYGFSRGREKNDNRSDNLIGILLAAFTAVGAVVALTTLVIAGYDWLPAVRAGNGLLRLPRFVRRGEPFCL